VCFLDRKDGTGEALAGILRPGNAGSNTAADHIEVVDLVLAQLPTAARDQPIVVRADTGGATHAFTSYLRERGVRFSISLPADERVRAAVLAVPHGAWQPAVDADGQPRDGAEVAELSSLDLAGWPPGTRAICRREDPHPGAQLCFTDADGHRFQVFITDQPDPNVATLELRHRRRARIEDRIRCGKAAGLRNLPFDLLRRNQVWLELVLAAQDLLCWAQALLLVGDLKVAEPKTLRYRLLHVVARVVRHARRLIIRLQRSWPWAAALAAAFARLRALPLRC
jgi:Transposase DDE domain group 1